MNYQNPLKAFLQKMEGAIRRSESSCVLCNYPWKVLEMVFSGKFFCTDAKRNGLFSYLRKVLGYSEHGPNFYKDFYPLLKTAANR